MKKLFIFLLIILVVSQFRLQASPKDTVKIGFYLQNLYDFNFTDREYTADFWLWLLYKNDSLFTEENITNLLEIPKNKSASASSTVIEKKKQYNWAAINYKATMQQPWVIKNFPFDEQTLHIRIEDGEHDIQEVVFTADTKNSKYNKNIAVEGWYIKDFKVEPKTIVYETSYGDPEIADGQSKYPAIDVTIQMKRNSFGLFLKLFSGVYIAFFIAMVNLFIDATEADPRFGLPVGGLFAAVGNKYIVDSILPESPTFTLVDKVHAIAFFFIFINILISVYSMYLMKTDQEAKAKKIDKITFYVLVSLFVFANLVTIISAAL